MTITTILLTVFSVMLVAAYALWDLGAHDLAVHFGSFVIRMITFGRVCFDAEEDEPAAIVISAAMVIVIFLCFLVIASRVQ